MIKLLNFIFYMRQEIIKLYNPRTLDKQIRKKYNGDFNSYLGTHDRQMYLYKFYANKVDFIRIFKIRDLFYD